MDLKKTIQNSSYVSFDADFYSTDINTFANYLNSSIGEKIEIFDENTNVYSREIFYISKSFEYGKERYKIISPLDSYSKSRKVLISIFDAIKNYGYTDSSCIFEIKLTVKRDKYRIKDLNVLKFILQFDEDEIFKLFPNQKDSIYIKSIKNFIPENKFYRPKLLKLKDFKYILPNMNFFGTTFNDIKSGFINFKYIGGEKYEEKTTQALDCLDFYINSIYKILYKPNFTQSNERTFTSILKKYDKVLNAYVSPEEFKKSFPDIKLTVDLEDNEQIIKSKYAIFRDDIFNLLASSDIIKGEINYDSSVSKIQARGISGNIYEIEGWEIVNSDLMIHRAKNCNFFETRLENSSLMNCNLYNFSSVKKSRIIDTYINRTCEITDSLISGETSIIDGKIIRGKIIGGMIGNHSEISKNTKKSNYTKIYRK